MQGEPVQYITGEQEFRSLAFEVNPHVLIPRPESELLVDYGVHWAKHWAGQNGTLRLRCLDVGTGSGNLGISLLQELPDCSVWAIDSSLAALNVARRNARRLGVDDRWQGLCGDLVEPLWSESPPFAVCLANLPYVTDAEWLTLPTHIRDHEPAAALLGGADGLDVIRRLVAAVPGVLAAQGTLLLEVGWQQAEAVEGLMRRTPLFKATGRYRDFAGIERVVWGRTS
jgi:release factor glutamine methyltransferase